MSFGSYFSFQVRGSRGYEEYARQQAQISASSSSSSSSSTSFSSSSSHSSTSSSSRSSNQLSANQNREGFGGRLSTFSNEDEDSFNVISTIARGPGDYHGTISKDELEKEAGGPIFTGSNQQVENTRYGGQSRYQGSVIADGAEETRLFDTQGQLIVKKSQGRKESTMDSSSQVSSSSTSDSAISSDPFSNTANEVVYSGWRRLDNGTYIRVYDNQKSSSSSSSSSSRSGSSGLGFGRSSSSEQLTLDNNGGSTSTHSSSSSSFSQSVASDTIGEDLNSGYMNTGWVQQPDGTYIRKQSSWSSSSSSSGQSGFGDVQGGGSQYSSSGSSMSTSGNRNSGGYSSGTNTIFGAAQGPGDYHGTMSKTELEREAGGKIFSGSRSQETRDQVDRTEYRGGQSYNSGGTYDVGGSYNSGGGYNMGETYSSGNTYSSSNSGYNTGSSSSDNDIVVTKGGRWVWSDTKNSWEWEGEDGSRGGSQSSGVQTDSGSDDSGWVQLSNGTWTRRQSSWSSSSQSGVRYGAQGQGQGQVGTGTIINGENAGEWGDHGTNSTGWVTQPDGTMTKKSSSWASWSSSSYDDVPGENHLDHVQRQLEQRVRNNLNRQLPSNVEPGFEDEYQRNRRSKRGLQIRYECFAYISKYEQYNIVCMGMVKK